MSRPGRVIWVEPAAPPKPLQGAACNGCGLCCLAEPCPVGMVLSRRRRGACDALRWDAGARHYRCGLVAAPADVLPLGRGPIARALGRALSRAARRWIAAGSGCDANFDTDTPVTGASPRDD